MKKAIGIAPGTLAAFRTAAFSITLIVALALTLALSLTTPVAFAQPPADRNPDFTAKPPAPEKMQEGMALWMALGQPSIYHQRLEYFIGEWDVVTRMWVEGPGSQPLESTGGRVTYRWQFEGRWLAEDFTGDMMGMPFTGLSLLGYDNFRREYVGIWIDSMSTTLSTMSGRLDQSGKVITLYGEMDEPITGELGKMAAYIFRIVDDNTHVFEIQDLGIGGENTKVMEMTYTRRR